MVFVLTLFLKTLIDSYFLASTCIVFVTDPSTTIENPKVNISIIILRINLTDEENTSAITNLFHDLECQDFLVSTKKPVSVFKEIEKEIKLTKKRFLNRRYVFLPSNIPDEDHFGVFETAEINFVSDLLIIKKEKCNVTRKRLSTLKIKNCEFSIWTHSYKGTGTRNKPYLLDKWFSGNQSFWKNSNLFPDKLRHQDGRELRMATFLYEPYSIVERIGENSYNYLGSEIKTAVTFAEYLDMTFVPVVNEEDYWGTVFDNWTGNGLMGNIVMDNADIGAGALYTWDSVYPFLELSKPTVRTGITCLVPAPKLSAGWLTPIYAFSWTMWLAVGFAFSTSVLINFLSQLVVMEQGREQTKKSKFDIFSKVLLLVFKPFVLQNVTSQEIIRDRLMGRFLMGLIFMTTLILSATYDSGFASIMTVPRYTNPIDTIEDFVDSGIKWGAQADAWITSIAGSEEEKYKKLVAQFEILSETQLREMSLSDKFAFSLERLPQGDFAIGNYIQNDIIGNFHLMQQDFYWEYCVIMTRRNSILLNLLDDFILRAFEAGLISVWQHEAASKYMNQYVQKAVKYLLHKKERTVVKLNILHVEGAFLIFVLGHFLGLLVFILEILIFRWRSR